MPTSTDTKILSVVTNFCNAQVPVLSFFQKNKKTLLTLASLAGAAGVGFLVKKEIKRREAIKQNQLYEKSREQQLKDIKTRQDEEEQKRRAANEAHNLGNRETPLRKFKTYLTTTHFKYFTLDISNYDTPMTHEFPSVEGANQRFLKKHIDRFIPGYNFLTNKEINLRLFKELAEKELTFEQLKELVTGCFKETTIDLLAKFQENYFQALAEEGDGELTTKKATAIIKLLEDLTVLNRIDPVEVKRILFFKPQTIYSLLLKQRFYSQIYWPQINVPSSYMHLSLQIDPYCQSSEPFCELIRRALLLTGHREAYCLGHFFPRDFAMFKDLHKVKLSAQK